MDIIDDLDSVDTRPIEVTDLSNTGEEEIFINELINVPLVKGEKGETGLQGEKGEKGEPNTLVIGTVEKGEEAVATIEGEAPNQILNLVLPKGDTGDQGADGETYDDTELKASINNKVDKIEGKGLSTNDFTNDLKQKLDDIGEGSFLPARRNYRTSTGKSK